MDRGGGELAEIRRVGGAEVALRRDVQADAFGDERWKERRQDFGSRVVVVLILCVDVFVVMKKIVASDAVSAFAAIASACVLFGLWHVWPWLSRRRTRISVDSPELSATAHSWSADTRD
jgi:hypothetical protein